MNQFLGTHPTTEGAGAEHLAKAMSLVEFDVPLSEMTDPWFSVELMVGVGLVVALVAAFAAKWLRSRQRKMLRDMRDSALW